MSSTTGTNNSGTNNAGSGRAGSSGPESIDSSSSGRTNSGPTSDTATRRHFLAGALTIGATMSIPWTFASTGTAEASGTAARRAQPTIRPRDDWSEGHGPTGTILAEEPKFLLVHHTGSPGNDYTSEDVPALLRSMYWYHTGEDKGWPDIAYNFLVDQFGVIWEGRAGSIHGPVRGSATGGNQGYSQLCCFIGNLDTQDPTPAAIDSMVGLLAWLASERAIDVSPGATATFTSLGSNKWPSGSTITTPTIAGHRDMSQTSCPGDRGYAFVTETLPGLVRTQLGMASGNATSETATTQDTGSSEADSSTTDTDTTTTTADTPTTDQAGTDTSDPRLGSSSTTTSTTPTLPPTTRPTNENESASGTQNPKSDESAQGVEDSTKSSGRRKWVPFAVGAGIAATLQGVAMTSRTKDRSGSLDEDPDSNNPPDPKNPQGPKHPQGPGQP